MWWVFSVFSWWGLVTLSGQGSFCATVCASCQLAEQLYFSPFIKKILCKGNLSTDSCDLLLKTQFTSSHTYWKGAQVERLGAAPSQRGIRECREKGSRSEQWEYLWCFGGFIWFDICTLLPLPKLFNFIHLLQQIVFTLENLGGNSLMAVTHPAEAPYGRKVWSKLRMCCWEGREACCWGWL